MGIRWDSQENGLRGYGGGRKRSIPQISILISEGISNVVDVF